MSTMLIPRRARVTRRTPLFIQRMAARDAAAVLALVFSVLAFAPLTAQCGDSPAPPRDAGLRMLGDDADDRRRILEILGRCSPDGRLLRATSTLNPLPAGADGVHALLPT